jgi:sec-independent protein translocase protein TatA
MGNLGWTEILVILVIALIIFGPRKLPELGKSLGQSLAQFRRASDDFKRTWEQEVEVEKRRLEAPPTIPSQIADESLPTVSATETPWQGGTEEAASASADEVLAGVQESESRVAETKRDWM